MRVAVTPYLSIVVTSRNDDHGGSLLRRTQTFVNALSAQVERYSLPTELIVVEWNPPPDRPPLRDALIWPSNPECLQVRFIQVPPAIHARYRHADALPLYQMIGKNVGIRRARGEYILATNIDILFSNQLMEFLADRNLQPGCMYRLDRHDVMSEVPVDAGIDERLEYCENHLLRLNAREGTYYVTPQGDLALSPKDISEPDSGIVLGSGWFPPEYDGDECFRWVDNDACVTVLPPVDGQPLLFEVQPGPSLSSDAFELMFVDDCGATLTTTIVSGRSLVKLQLPPIKDPITFRLRTDQGGNPIRYNPRILNFRVFRFHWGQEGHPRTAESGNVSQASGAAADTGSLAARSWRKNGSHLGPDAAPHTEHPQASATTIRPADFKISSEPISRVRSLLSTFAKGKEALKQAARGQTNAIIVPVPNKVRGWLRFFFPEEALQDSVKSATGSHEAATVHTEQQPSRESDASPEAVREPNADLGSCSKNGASSGADLANDLCPESDAYYQPAYLHTNGCGDFTLMAREHWLDLRGYPELDMYSFHIDSVFCFAAHHGGVREVHLKDPMRTYHIEHGIGSGWSPEGQDALFDRLRAKRIAWLEYSEVITWAAQMRRFDRPMIFNRGDWGLGEFELAETTLDVPLDAAV